MAVKKVNNSAKKQALPPVTYTIDLSLVAPENVIDIANFDKYMRDHIKVDGKVGQLGKRVILKKGNDSLVVTAEAPFSKRYLKYLTKKYLKKNELRDYLRIIANGKDSYQIKFFKIGNNDEE